MLLADGNDFSKDAISTSTSRMCCINVEWRPDMWDSTFTTRSLAISLIDSIWNLCMCDKPLTSTTNLGRFCVKMVIHAKMVSTLSCLPVRLSVV